jgi:hypothetical protein
MTRTSSIASRAFLGLIGLTFTFGLNLTETASAQTYRERQQQIELAVLALTAYEKSLSLCDYDSAVGKAFAEVDQFFEQTQPYAWQKAKRATPYGLNIASNVTSGSVAAFRSSASIKEPRIDFTAIVRRTTSPGSCDNRLSLSPLIGILIVTSLGIEDLLALRFAFGRASASMPLPSRM